MIDRFDANHRLRFAGADGAAGIVARPFAKRPLGARLFARRRNLAFDGDLRAGGNRQTGHGPRINSNGRPIRPPA